jgi:hypothetical protein
MDAKLVINFMHVLLICPALIYVGLSREKIPEAGFIALGCIGIVIFFYSRSDTESGWVYLLHILLVAPLLITIGFYGKQCPRRFFEMLLLVAFAAFGYHSLNIVRYWN